MKMNKQFLELQYDTKGYNSGEELHYDENQKKWVTEKFFTEDIYPASYPCRSYKAAKRHLRKHIEIPTGTRFRLISKWIGYDRYLIKR